MRGAIAAPMAHDPGRNGIPQRHRLPQTPAGGQPGKRTAGVTVPGADRIDDRGRERGGETALLRAEIAGAFFIQTHNQRCGIFLQPGGAKCADLGRKSVRFSRDDGFLAVDGNQWLQGCRSSQETSRSPLADAS